ncbi:MAG: hypothetical protein II843_01280 [Alphaproteobacteria bacterium]|nr:hypothetical protein [Alphaproteobacteria bacterium]
MTPRKYDYTPDEIEEITTQWKITQGTSERADTNFKCPCCHIKRVLKAKDKKNPNDWKHTGCVCTYKYLDITGQLIRNPF